MDEVPDEGLDVPLRLEKLANEVTHRRLRAALSVRARRVRAALPLGGVASVRCAEPSSGCRRLPHNKRVRTPPLLSPP